MIDFVCESCEVKSIVKSCFDLFSVDSWQVSIVLIFGLELKSNCAS